MLGSKHAQLASYYSVWNFLCGVFVVSMTTKYRAHTRATASSPHGTTVVEDGKEDNTQKLPLLLGQALTCHSHTDKESVYYSCDSVWRCLHCVHEICMCVIYLCILFSEWGIFMEFECISVHSLRDCCYLMPYIYLLKSVPVVYVCVIIKAQLWNHPLQLSSVQWDGFHFILMFSVCFLSVIILIYRFFFRGPFWPCGLSESKLF